MGWQAFCLDCGTRVGRKKSCPKCKGHNLGEYQEPGKVEGEDSGETAPRSLTRTRRRRPKPEELAEKVGGVVGRRMVPSAPDVGEALGVLAGHLLWQRLGGSKKRRKDRS